jgi:hypothetical protein
MMKTQENQPRTGAIARAYRKPVLAKGPVLTSVTAVPVSATGAT